MASAAFDARMGETFNPWPALDMEIMSAGRRPAPTMPPGLLGPAWSLVEDLAEGAGSPVDYVAISFLGTVASLIGGKRSARPYSTTDWSEPCILWFAAVGDPSSHKSPAIDTVTSPLRKMEAAHAELNRIDLMGHEAKVARAKAERAAWEDAVKAAQRDGVSTPPLPDSAVIPDKPERRRLLVQDSTPEAIGSILAGNPQGTLHLRDELAGWLMSFDRYTPGGRQFWIEAYGGRPHVIDRKSSPMPLLIPFNGVSVLGGIQPEKMAECLLNTADDGLVARFIWAWPNAIPYRRPRQCADREALVGIFTRLDALPWGIDAEGKDTGVTLSLDAKAADLFEAWARESQANLDDAGALYKGFCGKLKGTVLRLSLVCELLAWAVESVGPDPRSISIKSVAAAIDFVEEFAKPSALRVFGDAVVPATERNAAVLGRYIRRNNVRQFNARELRRKAGLPGMRDPGDFNKAVEALAEAGWLRSIASREGDTAGRQRSDFLVNPAVMGA